MNINERETSAPTQSPISVGQLQQETSSSEVENTNRCESMTEAMGDEEKKKRIYLHNLCEDLKTIPLCAEKTTIQLLLHYENNLLGDELDTDENDVNSLLEQLLDQMKKEELISTQVTTHLKDLERSVHREDFSSVVKSLKKLLECIRPINMHEMKRLVDLTNESAKLIADKEIVLLVGSTGAGKSTTIHFLAGSEMKMVREKISDGTFLNHIKPVKLPKNKDLIRVTTSPHSISETRYIWPVTIALKDIASYMNGDIILCDAPGFADTSGPEVDIANSLGVIDALSGCKSVKILVLSSYINLGDRGQGIQELAHILSKMIKDVEDRLGSIFYVFTKFPLEINDIHARLIDIRDTKVPKDLRLSTDISFLTVLNDMIKKTKPVGFQIDPINGSPEELIKKIKSLSPIRYPRDIFRFTMSQETREAITNYTQHSRLSVKCAMKYKNIDLIVYYLDNLKALKGLIKESIVQDAYEKSVLSVSENIDHYCEDVTKKIHFAFESQYGLKEEDVQEYKMAVDYIEKLGKSLSEHLESRVPKPERLIHNIERELKQKRCVLEKTDLQNHLIGLHLHNLYILKKAFPELNLIYNADCKYFEEQFSILIKSVNENIENNEFDKVAEHMLALSKSSCVLKCYLGEQLEDKYHSVIVLFLKHVYSYVEKSEPLLQKIRLNDDDVQKLKNHLDILRSAKETPTLQECLSIYMETLKAGIETMSKTSKSLNEIYNEFIEKVVVHFDQINVKIRENFERAGDCDLESIEKLVQDMNSIREIPEIEVKTSASYYRTVENIRGYIQQLQRDGEQLIVDIEKKTGDINYKHLGRLLSRIKNAECINRATPGAYDRLITRIKEDLIDNARNLEEQLIRLEFHLKHPENVSVAYAIVERIEYMRILETNVPELKDYREKIQHMFRETAQAALDNIQKQFNLQDRDVYRLKQQLMQLERIKNEYENLHPAQKYLLEQQYSNIDELDDDIERISKKQQQETANEEREKLVKEDEVKKLQDIIDQCGSYNEESNLPLATRMLNFVASHSPVEKKVKQEAYLRERGFSQIDDVYEAKRDAIKEYDTKLRQIQADCKKLSEQIISLEEIKKEYKSLLLVRSDSFCSERIRYLHENKKESIESINDEIQEKKSIISKREKNKQKYDFNGRFDGSMASLALFYTSKCETVRDSAIKQTAIETNHLLQKYLAEYALFLEQEMSRLYQNGKNIEIDGGSFQYCHELCLRLEELLFLEKFSEVSHYLKTTESLTKWRQEIMSYYTTSSDQMADFQKRDERELLGKQLAVIKGFIALDRFFGNNLFYELHKKFQSNVIDDLTDAYRRILQHIHEFDYVRASYVLSDIDDKPLHVKAKRQIELELQSSLSKLMKDTKRSAQWLYGKIEREEENAKQFLEIVTNLEKISSAETKLNLMELLDEKFKSDVKNFPVEIDKILSEMILQALNSIEMYINTDNFAQAEEGLKKINNVVEHHLKSVINDEGVIKKSQELRNKLNELATNISTRIDFSDIDKYFEKPPKDLLDNLRLLSKNNDQYNQIYKALLGKLKRDLKDTLEKIGKLPMKQRSAKLRTLTHALSYIPEDLQVEFKSEINEMTEYNRSIQKEYENELARSLKGEQENEQTWMKISELAKNFEEQGMDELADHMYTEVLKRIQNYRTQFQSALEMSDMQSALQQMHKIIKCKDHVSQYFPGIKEVYDSSRKLTVKSFEDYSKALADISKIEKPETVENAFNNVIMCMKFSNHLEKPEEKFLPETVLKKCENDLEVMQDYLQGNSEKYRHALESMIVDDLHSTILICKKWQNLLQQVKDCNLEDESTRKILLVIQNVVTHRDMLAAVTKEISRLKADLNVDLITDETTRYQHKREEFFRNLNSSLNKLKEIDEKLSDVLTKPVHAKESQEHLNTKVKRICDALLEVSCRPQLNENECNKFRKYYQHLLAINEHLTFPDAEVKEYLDESKSKILEKVTSVQNELSAMDKADCEKASMILIEMKSLAENLMMFDTEINREVDRSLKSFKAKHGPAPLSKLSMKLQQSDVGMRIMSEHAILKAEDWRCRNLKTQAQNNIDYVLDLLEGDDLDKDVLRSRYEVFKTTYDDILLKNVGSPNERSNLDTLAANTRCFVDTLLRNSSTKVMSRSFQDAIPELLADIFAIWTLQNTEYYNEMRGIESRDAYLLRPHVAQIIAIFRILGIGYKTATKDKNLFNNLVQIGTGEGKSVVLAAVSCVFALAGIDVNCSCYSRDLSTRDKEAFAPLFEILGVSQHIDYGTFNKLCENLLNEQCNVREKVCDMILKNKSCLEVVQQKKCRQEKVLLIDEVDVFLSDEYYGGVYTPVFYLKHPLIKALLDQIWANKTIRTLNGIKALSVYTACAQAFSNWTFLLDEAIKDLIAALKSYQSSTYHVRNNKIVYVEGESLVENIVRGYDTLWAYYHENSKGEISSDSLEQNVGILVNCGTFSFAEMPHDFFYITGVTGTLKTLADAEKEILTRIYKVKKNTYMPSLFGGCRRTEEEEPILSTSEVHQNYEGVVGSTIGVRKYKNLAPPSLRRKYNTSTDVRAVPETEYFTLILDEIVTMRRAKRAILVFFESEEKLKKFYSSSETLSNDSDVQIMIETVAVKDRQLLIRRAATIDRVTLLTRTFGRGTDFICNNQTLLANDGVHVLQTFFSKELSEEYQIIGRGARQGDQGSYRMILLDKDLEWVLGSSWESRLKEISGRSLYDNLNSARNAIFQSRCNSKGVGIEQRRKEHDLSKKFMEAVNKGDIEAVKIFLKNENQGANIPIKLSRTMLLMDATGSMSSLLSAVKETVCSMFEEAVKVLEVMELPSDAFQMQFVVYRDYDCKQEGILQSSSWESKPNNLKKFIAPIAATGGGDYEEAIEIGLWYAVQQSEEPDGLAQVILIGDAPAKAIPAIERDRRANGGEAYWCKTKYKTQTNYVDELTKLRERNIPVHTFYLSSDPKSDLLLKKNFEQIALLAGGRCQQLDIYQPKGAEMLTDYVTKEILRKAAGERGNEAVEHYIKDHPKGWLG